MIVQKLIVEGTIFIKLKNDANHGMVWNEKKLLNFKKQNGYKAKYKRDLTILIK